MFHVPEEYRITKSKNPTINTTKEFGNNGMFAIQKGAMYARRDKGGFVKGQQKVSPQARLIYVVASDQLGWEHVSVSIHTPGGAACPSWDEMCDIKAMFWDEEDVVVQYHPRKSEYVNNHSSTLHMWRPVDVEIPTPPHVMVGIKELGTIK